MTGDLLAQVLAEVESLLLRVGLRGTNVRVLSCDAQVHSVKRVSHTSQVELLGGGGTDMGAGITQALALRPRPSIIVVLTDGFTPWPAEAPEAPRWSSASSKAVVASDRGCIAGLHRLRGRES